MVRTHPPQLEKGRNQAASRALGSGGRFGLCNVPQASIELFQSCESLGLQEPFGYFPSSSSRFSSSVSPMSTTSAPAPSHSVSSALLATMMRQGSTAPKAHGAEGLSDGRDRERFNALLPKLMQWKLWPRSLADPGHRTRDGAFEMKYLKLLSASLMVGAALAITVVRRTKATPPDPLGPAVNALNASRLLH